MSEAYSLPMNAKSLVGSVMANLCRSHFPIHMGMVEAFSQRVLIHKAFSVPKCVRLTRMSHHSHRLLRKMLGVVPEDQCEDLSEIWVEELLSLEKLNASDLDRQNTIGKTTINAQAVDEVDVMSLSGTDSMVPGAVEPLLDMGCGDNSVNRAARSSTEGHSLRGELDAGAAMD